MLENSQLKSRSREILLNYPLVTEEILKKFEKIEGSSLNRFSKKVNIYEKKRLLEHFEQQYSENVGSHLLAKGVIEHLFLTKKLPSGCKREPKDNEEVSLEDMKEYLADYLLTPNRSRQLQTAFTLYLYISRHKIFH